MELQVVQVVVEDTKTEAVVQVLLTKEMQVVKAATVVLVEVTSVEVEVVVQ